MGIQIITARIAIRLVIFGLILGVAYILNPENALTWAIIGYLAYLILSWMVFFTHRALLTNVSDIVLGPTPPRFTSAEGIIAQLEFLEYKIQNDQTEQFDYLSPKYPIELDQEMDTVIDSISRLTDVQKATFFETFYNRDRIDNLNKYHDYVMLFWRIILRYATRAVREKDTEHLVRGIYCARISFFVLDYRDVLVVYSAIWDAARRLHANIKPVAAKLALGNTEMDQLLRTPTAPITQMGIQSITDKHGFRYQYDHSW